MNLKKAALTSFTVLCLLSALFLIGDKTSVKASPHVIYVPTDFPTIQEAISHANSGDTIFVYNQTYYEHLVIDKSISLIGEDRDSTIIDGGGTGTVISVTADSVNVSGFTIQKSGRGPYHSGIMVNYSRGNNMSHNTMKDNNYGIYLDHSSDNILSGNSASNNNYGIYLDHSSDNILSGNSASNNNYHGIYLHSSSNNTVSGNSASNNNYGIYFYSSSNNTVSGNSASNNYYGISLHSSIDNTLSCNSASSNNYHGISLHSSIDNTLSCNSASSNNHYGIYLRSSSNNNTIYHNNFMHNLDQVWSDSVNLWDDSSEGNYWSDYPGEDRNADGIGDTPYFIDVRNQDNHPLMGRLSDFKITWKEQTYHATTICNSTISEFGFEVGKETGNKIISFRVTGEDDTGGFCRVATPADLVNYPFVVLVDEEEIAFTLLDDSDETHVHLYFTYVHSSHNVTLISSKLLYAYDELLDKYSKLQTDFDDLHSTFHELVINYSVFQHDFHELVINYSVFLESLSTLNSTTHELLDSYGTLLDNYNQLLERYDELNASYQEHLLGYSKLQGNYTSLLSEHAQNIRSLVYVIIATTAMLIVAAVYLSISAHKRIS